jgi:hypothetical protein
MLIINHHLFKAHFEESQFESHRADGLRKLKPNAIPTIFNRVTPQRSYTRKAKKESTSANVCVSNKFHYKNTVFWNVTSYSLQHVRKACCIYLQDKS